MEPRGGDKPRFRVGDSLICLADKALDRGFGVNEPHSALLAGQGKLDLGGGFESQGISFGDSIGHRPPRLTPMVDIALEHARGEQRLVLLTQVEA